MHPNDLKPSVSKVINELIEPVRKHFETNPQAKALLKTIDGYKPQNMLNIDPINQPFKLIGHF